MNINASAQRQPVHKLRPDTNYRRVACINHFLLRQQYVDLKEVHQDHALKNKAEDNSHTTSLENNKKTFQEKLRLDSINNGGKKLEIQQNAEASKKAIEQEHIKKLKTIHSDHVARLKNLENKIQKAIKTIELEKGYTKILSIHGTTTTQGIDITQLVLKKLQ
jgi:hypothetical protein